MHTVVTKNGNEYHIDMEFTSDDIHIGLRTKEGAYSGIFSADYIDNLTKKTGNYKKFNIFVEMMTNAIEKTNKTVSLDILTMADLQQKHGDKLYLVVTYAVAFDRVHYPLPLVKEHDKEYKHLQDQYNHAMIELQKLSRENDKLRHSLKEEKRLNERSKVHDLSSTKADLAELTDELELLAQSKCAHSTIQNTLSRMADKLMKYCNDIEQKGIPIIERTRTRPKDRVEINRKTRSSAEINRTRSNSAPKKVSIEKKDIKRSYSTSSPKKAYTVIKSQPLKPKAHFQRFDPTQYVREKEARLERSRSNSRMSRNSSVGSINTPHKSTGVVNSSSRMTLQESPRANKHMRAAPNGTLKASGYKSMLSLKVETRSSPELSKERIKTIPRQIQLSKDRKRSPKRIARSPPNTREKWKLELEKSREIDSDPDSIDQRLLKLEAILHNSLI
ncbi:Coiled-coil domain-containing protein 61 [Terramyces sp. JEL0728]|nr:Coiled-coil domain-containing protein 61 [Terramyces sp. JEL0728]